MDYRAASLQHADRKHHRLNALELQPPLNGVRRFVVQHSVVPLFFAEDQELVKLLFQSAWEFVNSVRVRRLTFVPDQRVWELIA